MIRDRAGFQLELFNNVLNITSHKINSTDCRLNCFVPSFFNCELLSPFANHMHDTMEEESTPKSTTVERPLHVDVDLGNLLLSDTNEIAVKSLRFV